MSGMQRLGIAQALVGGRRCSFSTSRRPRSTLRDAATSERSSGAAQARRRGPAELAPALRGRARLRPRSDPPRRRRRRGGTRTTRAPARIEIETDDGLVHLEGGREEAARAVDELVRAGRKVYRVEVRSSTLEEVYLEAVGE
jgi:hypothetical protein